MQVSTPHFITIPFEIKFTSTIKASALTPPKSRLFIWLKQWFAAVVAKKIGWQSGIFRNKHEENCIFESCITCRQKKGGNNLQLNGSHQHSLFILLRKQVRYCKHRLKAGGLASCPFLLLFIGSQLEQPQLPQDSFLAFPLKGLFSMQVLISNA